MDTLDQRLITALRHDARASISELASQLGITRATVRARLERLTQTGTIVGYTVVLRSDAFELPVRGIMLIGIDGGRTNRIIHILEGFSEVTAIHTTNGRWDLILEVATETLTSFDEVLRRIRLIDGIMRSETNLILTTPRSSKAMLVD